MSDLFLGPGYTAPVPMTAFCDHILPPLFSQLAPERLLVLGSSAEKLARSILATTPVPTLQVQNESLADLQLLRSEFPKRVCLATPKSPEDWLENEEPSVPLALILGGAHSILSELGRLTSSFSQGSFPWIGFSRTEEAAIEESWAELEAKVREVLEPHPQLHCVFVPLCNGIALIAPREQLADNAALAAFFASLQISPPLYSLLAEAEASRLAPLRVRSQERLNQRLFSLRRHNDGLQLALTDLVRQLDQEQSLV